MDWKKREKEQLTEINKEIRGPRTEHPMKQFTKPLLPKLKPGEYIYMVRCLGSRKLKFVIARGRQEAELKAFPTGTPLMAMPVKSYGG